MRLLSNKRGAPCLELARKNARMLIDIYSALLSGWGLSARAHTRQVPRIPAVHPRYMRCEVWRWQKSEHCRPFDPHCTQYILGCIASVGEIPPRERGSNQPESIPRHRPGRRARIDIRIAFPQVTVVRLRHLTTPPCAMLRRSALLRTLPRPQITSTASRTLFATEKHRPLRFQCAGKALARPQVRVPQLRGTATATATATETVTTTAEGVDVGVGGASWRKRRSCETRARADAGNRSCHRAVGAVRRLGTRREVAR